MGLYKNHYLSVCYAISSWLGEIKELNTFSVKLYSVLVLISCDARMKREWGSYFNEPESKLHGQILLVSELWALILKSCLAGQTSVCHRSLWGLGFKLFSCRWPKEMVPGVCKVDDLGLSHRRVIHFCSGGVFFTVVINLSVVFCWDDVIVYYLMESGIQSFFCFNSII